MSAFTRPMGVLEATGQSEPATTSKTLRRIIELADPADKIRVSTRKDEPGIGTIGGTYTFEATAFLDEWPAGVTTNDIDEAIESTRTQIVRDAIDNLSTVTGVQSIDVSVDGYATIGVSTMNRNGCPQPCVVVSFDLSVDATVTV